MKSTISPILLVGFFLIILELGLSGCSQRCQVNGCRVRMEHEHGGEKFKSRIRRWYTYQDPTVGRDYRRDIPADQIPWVVEPVEPDDETLMAGNDSTWSELQGDSTGTGQDDFFGEDDFEDEYGEEEGVEKKKKKKKKKKGEEEEEKKLDPFFYGDDDEDEDDDDGVIDW